MVLGRERASLAVFARASFFNAAVLSFLVIIVLQAMSFWRVLVTRAFLRQLDQISLLKNHMAQQWHFG